MGQVLTTATNYRDKMKINSGFALADKSDDIVDIFGPTSINRPCVWRFGECMAQLFQRFFPIIDIATLRLKCITRLKGRDGDTITIFFPACKGWTQDQLSIGRHPHKDLK